jgi:FAD/FMN-containing dehydrogenase
MTIWNWNDSARCTPAEVVAPRTVPELIDIVTDTKRYPGPVRAVGELHSLNASFTTPGTLLFMHHFKDYALDEESGTVTVGAGWRMIDLKNKLKERGYQIEVVPEIGNATAGSVACCGTKDSSLGLTGHGQISSTVVAVEMVDAKGVNVTISQPARLREIRSSYGLFGIIHRVTFAIQRREKVRYRYAWVPLDDWLKATPPRQLPVPTSSEILGGADGFLAFLLPYRRALLVERRRRLADAAPTRFRDWWGLFWRTLAWKIGARPFFILVLPFLPDVINRWLLKAYSWCLDHGLRWFLVYWVGSYRSYRADGMIDFKRSLPSYFEFTFWAFPVSRWGTVIPAYLEFCAEFKRRTGFRPMLPTEAYFIRKDTNALLSFSSEEDIFTLDMVDSHPRTPEEVAYWRWMNREFNDFAARHGARPLLNQTKELSRANVHRALGQDWHTFVTLRQQEDPSGRFLNDFFNDLL